MAAKKSNTVPVTERALIQRINRKLRKDAEMMKITRPGTQAAQELGRYYVVDSRNHVVNGYDDLEAVGRELGVLAQYEHMV
jgi:hypothetical protein